MAKENKLRRKKIITLSELAEFNKKHQRKKIILVGGCFDIFHFGHLNFLRKAKKQGNLLVIALESDEFIRKRKRKEPIHNHSQRAQILAHLDMVDCVILLPLFKDYKDYLNLVESIKPSVIAVTKGDPYLFEKTKQALSIGAQLKIVCSLGVSHSTTKILKYAAIFSN